DSSINLRGTTQQSEFLDYEWIMSANNGPSSAFSRGRSPQVRSIWVQSALQRMLPVF
uniref:TOG domain-containing protein n=1 Tax=Parascaris univalens TaxID=6257 RepID=A0A915C448_PARUN